MSTERAAIVLQKLIEKTIELRITEKLGHLTWNPNEIEYLNQLLTKESIVKFVTDEWRWFNGYFEENIYKIAYPEAPEKNRNFYKTLQHSRLLFLTTIKQQIGLRMRTRWQTLSAKRAATAARNEAQKETKGEFKQYFKQL